MPRHLWVIETRDPDGEWRPQPGHAHLTKGTAEVYQKILRDDPLVPGREYQTTKYVAEPQP